MGRRISDEQLAYLPYDRRRRVLKKRRARGETIIKQETALARTPFTTPPRYKTFNNQLLDFLAAKRGDRECPLLSKEEILAIRTGGTDSSTYPPPGESVSLHAHGADGQPKAFGAHSKRSQNR